MSQAPFSFLNYFSLSSFKGLNWFEGLKRIKIFLQWLWGVPVGLGIVLFSAGQLLHGGLSFEVFFWEIVILLPILGFELLFRAVVWIVAGFLDSGDSKSQAVEMAQAYSREEIKKKINKLWFYWISDLKKTRLRDILWTAFLILWIVSSNVAIVNTSLSPFSHWREGGLSFSLQNLDILTLIKVGYFIILTVLKVIFDIIVLSSGPLLYQAVSSKILKKIDFVKEE
jgi:hypothetical protein